MTTQLKLLFVREPSHKQLKVLASIFKLTEVFFQFSENRTNKKTGKLCEQADFTFLQHLKKFSFFHIFLRSCFLPFERLLKVAAADFWPQQRIQFWKKKSNCSEVLVNENQYQIFYQP